MIKLLITTILYVKGDAVDFMSWILNAMHGALNGTRKLNSSIINKTFRGTMKVFTRKVLPIELVSVKLKVFTRKLLPVESVSVKF